MHRHQWNPSESGVTLDVVWTYILELVQGNLVLVVLVLVCDLIILEKLCRSLHKNYILMGLVLIISNQKSIVKSYISLQCKLFYYYICIIQLLYGDLINFPKINRSQLKTSNTIVWCERTINGKLIMMHGNELISF